MREKEHFRDELDRLSERFPGREAIELAEAADVLGCCYKTLQRDDKFPQIKIRGKWVVPLVRLASYLA